MAHNLYRNTMAFVGAKPWHMLGKEFTEKFTAEQAAAETGIGFEVKKERLYRQTTNKFGLTAFQPADSWVTVNGDTNEVLGVVGSDYTPAQFKEIASFFDVIAGEMGARFVTAGAIGKGEKLWLLAELNDYFEVVPGDRVDPYIMFSNSHDGSSAAQARFTDIRTVCQNTFNMALRNSRPFVSLRHSSKIAERIQIAAHMMKTHAQHLQEMGESLAKLAAYRIDDLWLDQYMAALFGNPMEVPEGAARTICEKKIRTFENYLENGMGAKMPGVKGTAWGALNAAVEYADYSFPMRASTDRVDSILWGGAFRFKQKAQDLALVLAGAV